MYADSMEKKKTIWDDNPFRAIFSFRNFSGNLFGKLYRLQFSKNGFTLVEILIVIVLIGILAAGLIAVINPMEQIQKAQDTKRKSDLSQIQQAVEAYYQNIGKYPTSTTDFKIQGQDGNTVEWGASFLPYMSILPKDPSQTKTYMYYSESQSQNQNYFVYAKLDRGSRDLQVCQRRPGVFECRFAAVAKFRCGEPTPTICDYGVSSPNISP
jgi:type II secretion system protein G